MLEFIDDRAHRDAAQIAFFAVFSFIPLALLLVAAFGLFVDGDEVRNRVVGTALDGIPMSQDEDRERLEGTLLSALDAAGRLGPFTVLLLIAGGSGVMSALRHAINQAWDIHSRPPLLRRKALDVALILGATVILAFSLSSSATRRASELLDDEAGGGWLAAGLLDALGDVLPFLFTAGVIGFLYRVLPMHRPRVREIWLGAVVATALLGIVRAALEVYFEEFADLGALYGSLGALMALLLFVYAASNVILFGAEFASEWARLPGDEEVHGEIRRGREWVRAKLRR
ncbi:MAG TPA: YihY/virulence factor BrkB family protein [Solirubrobacteraceae bacterium]